MSGLMSEAQKRSSLEHIRPHSRGTTADSAARDRIREADWTGRTYRNSHNTDTSLPHFVGETGERGTDVPMEIFQAGTALPVTGSVVVVTR